MSRINTNWAGSGPTAPVGMFGDDAIRQPMFGGAPRPARQGMFQGQPGNEVSQLFAMAANMAVPTMLGMTPGEIAVSQFSPQHSLITRMQQAEHAAAVVEARKSMRTFDTQGKTLTGARQMLTGKTATAAERLEDQKIAEISHDFGMPMLKAMGVSEETIDKFYGKRGSAGMFLNQFEKASATTIDPTTGGVGLVGKSLAGSASRVFENLYGDKANLSQMRGLSARQAGAMYGEMRSRGLTGRNTDTMSLTEQRSRLDGNMSDESLQRIANNMDSSRKSEAAGTYDDKESKKALEEVKQTHKLLKDPTFKQTREELSKLAGAPDLMMTVNADVVSSKLKGMSKAFAAMNKVFGEHGNTTAPASQVMDAMQKLTNNSLQSMSDADVTKAITLVDAVSRQTGVDFEAVMNSKADMAAMLRKNGGDSRDADKLTGSGAIFAAAARDTGLTNLGVRGTQDIEEVAQIYDRRTVAAMMSESGNNIGAARRIVEEGLVDPAKRGALDAMLKATAAGETEFTFNGKKHDVTMNKQQFSKFLQDNTGLSASSSNTLIGDKPANMNAITGEDAGSVLNSQLTDLVKDKIQRPLQTVLLQNINDKDRKKFEANGINVREVESRTAQILGVSGIQNMPKEAMEDPEARNKWFAEQAVLAEEKSAYEMISDPVEAKAFLATRAASRDNTEHGKNLLGAEIASAYGKGLEGTLYKTATGAVQQFSNTVVKQNAAGQARAAGEAVINEKLGSLGLTDPIRRAVDAISSAKPTTGFLEISKNILGVTSSEQLLGKHNQAALLEYADAQKELLDVVPGTPPGDIKKIKDKMLAAANRLDPDLIDQGISLPGSKEAEDPQKKREEAAWRDEEADLLSGKEPTVKPVVDDPAKPKTKESGEVTAKPKEPVVATPPEGYDGADPGKTTQPKELATATDAEKKRNQDLVDFFAGKEPVVADPAKPKTKESGEVTAKPKEPVVKEPTLMQYSPGHNEQVPVQVGAASPSGKNNSLDLPSNNKGLDQITAGEKAQEVLSRMAVARGKFGPDATYKSLTNEQKQRASELLADDPAAKPYLAIAEQYQKGMKTKDKLVEQVANSQVSEQSQSSPTVAKSTATADTPNTPTSAGSGETINITGGNIKVDLANGLAEFFMTGAKTNALMQQTMGRTV